MDAKNTQLASQTLKYQTWFLKVSIHCEGCRRKVKKVLQSIDGVFTTTIDPQQQKVTVTGSVGVETLIRKLAKAGKHAEVWPENLAGKGKDSNKAKKKKKKSEKQRDPESVEKENHSSANTESNSVSGKDRGIQSDEKCNGKSTKTGAGLPEKSQASGQVPENDHKGGGGKSEGGTGKSCGGGDSGKKKKIKKAQSGGGGGGSNSNNGLSSALPTSGPAHTGSQFQCPTGQFVGQMNLSPTRQQSYYQYPETWYTPLVHFATYNPMGTMGGPSSYYVPPLPYMCSGMDRDNPYYHFQSAPLASFEIFSDENANGCSVM